MAVDYQIDREIISRGLQRMFALRMNFNDIDPSRNGLNPALVETGVELFHRRNLGLKDRLMVIVVSAPGEEPCRRVLKLYGLEPELIELIEAPDETEQDEITADPDVGHWIEYSPAGALAMYYELPYPIYWSGVTANPENTLFLSEFSSQPVFGTLAAICINTEELNDHEIELRQLALAQLLTGYSAALGDEFYDFYSSDMLDQLDGFHLAAESDVSGWYQGIDADDLNEIKKRALLQAIEKRRVSVLADLIDFFGGSWGLFYALTRALRPDYSLSIVDDMNKLGIKSAQDAMDGNPELFQAWSLIDEGEWDFNDDY